MTTADTAVHKTVRLDSLTSLRFFAALLVVLNHVTRDGGQFGYVSYLFTSGTVGVGFFFALSGFVLMWSAREGDTPLRFYRRRFARVYPMHFITFLIAIPLLIALGGQLHLREVFASPLMLSSWFNDSTIYFGMNAPSWSLSDETLFYALFPLAYLVIRRLSSRVVWIVVAVLVVAYFALAFFLSPHTNATFWFYVFPPFRLLGFIAGCCTARLVANGLRLRIPLAIVLVVVVAVFVGVNQYVRGFGHGVEDAIMLPFVLLLLVVGATSDIEGRSPWLRTRALVRLGEWSFALYLTHWLLLEGTVHVFPGWRTLPDGLRVGADVLFICVAIGVSALAYNFVEKPLERRLRGPARPVPEPAETVVEPAAVDSH